MKKTKVIILTAKDKKAIADAARAKAAAILDVHFKNSNERLSKNFSISENVSSGVLAGSPMQSLGKKNKKAMGE